MVGRLFAGLGLALLALAAQAPAAAPALAAPETVAFGHAYPVGSIIVVNKERRLYFVIGKGKALRYPVAVGVPAEQWTGRSYVSAKKKDPSWTPTADMLEKNPDLPAFVEGGPKSPLGVRALYLGSTTYRIHGTISPKSIGRAASNGCIRMFNADVKDLYRRARVGTPVFVVNHLKGGAKAEGKTKLRKRLRAPAI